LENDLHAPPCLARTLLRSSLKRLTIENYFTRVWNVKPSDTPPDRGLTTPRLAYECNALLPANAERNVPGGKDATCSTRVDSGELLDYKKGSRRAPNGITRAG
jgi:hypothetical protein